MLISLYILIATYLTILSVTLYLHRSMTHGSVKFNKYIEYLMRTWLWLNTGMKTFEWVAIHRYHHKHTDTRLDPHSPNNHGWLKVLFYGAMLYVKEKSKPEILKEVHGDDTLPNDFFERNIFATNYNYMGIFLMLGFNIGVFGFIGFFIWLFQVLWIPFWAAGIINGVSHTFGYTNFKKHTAPEKIGNSKNIFPLGIIIGGEELHNNHHRDMSSAKFSYKWYEFDMGWLIILFLKFFGLAKLQK